MEVLKDQMMMKEEVVKQNVKKFFACGGIYESSAGTALLSFSNADNTNSSSPPEIDSAVFFDFFGPNTAPQSFSDAAI